MVNRKSLSPNEIRVILEACEKTGVAELAFGDFQVIFGLKPRKIWEESDQSLAQPEPFQSHSRPTVGIVGIQENIARKALEDDEIALKEDQIADLLIEDPVELERMVRDGEITDEFTGSAEEA